MSDLNNDQGKKKVSSATFDLSSQGESSSPAAPKAQTAEFPADTVAPDSGPAPENVARLPGNGTPPPLASAPLAYENPTFLNSADGRLIRIVAEFMEPLARFRRERIQDTVVFFGSARFRGKEEADHELELLDNTGSTRPAPSEEQPAKPPDIAAGKATDLQRKRAVAARS